MVTQKSKITNVVSTDLSIMYSSKYMIYHSITSLVTLGIFHHLLTGCVFEIHLGRLESDLTIARGLED